MTDDFATRIAAGYATTDPCIDIGRAVHDGTAFPDATVQVPLAMCNRHGLIAGATGTGKTVTLQLLAEQLSARGVPVFAADIKGDLTGVSRPAGTNEKVAARVQELKLGWAPASSPVEFLSLGGIGPGVPLRASVGSFGPDLLVKVLGANETQRSSLSLVFHYADQKGLPLLDLVDLADVLRYLTGDDGKAELKAIGGLSSATAGVLLRSISELDQQGAEAFFGEPELSVNDLLRTAPDGRGIISVLELAAVQDKPKLFSTFLMWLLAELFHELPEAGDLPQPKLVFFFDEAHLLFDDASKELIDEVAQTVRLIRSKGVGVFFVTQLPDDVPEAVLGQLGNRIQHGLRAFTPRDAKALKAAVTTYPKTDDYDLESALTSLGIGEAMVTILSEKGAPTPVAWTKVRPPQSLIGAVPPDEVDAEAKASPLWATYGTEIDRESAAEMLAVKMGEAAAVAVNDAGTLPPPPDSGMRVRVPEPNAEPVRRRPSAKAAPRERPKAKDDGNVVTGYLKSREGRSMINTVLRGAMGVLKRRN